MQIATGDKSKDWPTKNDFDPSNPPFARSGSRSGGVNKRGRRGGYEERGRGGDRGRGDGLRSTRGRGSDRARGFRGRGDRGRGHRGGRGGRSDRDDSFERSRRRSSSER